MANRLGHHAGYSRPINDRQIPGRVGAVLLALAGGSALLTVIGLFRFL